MELGVLSSFDPKGDPTMLCVRWKRWKRAFNLYVKSRGVSDEGQKVALMLGAFHLVRTHLGGVGGVKPPIHFLCVLHAKRGRGGGPDSM